MIRRVNFLLFAIMIALMTFSQCTETKTESVVLNRSELVQRADMIEQRIGEQINVLDYDEDEVWFQKPDKTCGVATFEQDSLIDIESTTCIIDDINGI